MVTVAYHGSNGGTDLAPIASPKLEVAPRLSEFREMVGGLVPFDERLIRLTKSEKILEQLPSREPTSRCRDKS